MPRATSAKGYEAAREILRRYLQSDAPSRICVGANAINAVTSPHPPPRTRSRSHARPQKDTRVHISEGPPPPLISHALTTTPNNFRISPQFLPCTWNGLVAWTHIGEGGIASKIKRWCALGGFTLRGDILKLKFLINSFDKNTRRRHVREGPHAGCRGSPRQLPPSTQRGLIEHLLAVEINLSE